MTNTIAERAGVSIGSLYQYFEGRDAILAALIERDLAAKERVLIEIVERHGDEPIEMVVHRLIHAMSEMIFGQPGQPSQPEFLRRLLVHASRLGRVGHILSHRMRITHVFATLIARRPDLAHVHDPERSAYLLIHAVMGVFQAMLFEGAPIQDVEPKLRDLERMVLLFLLDDADRQAAMAAPSEENSRAISDG